MASKRARTGVDQQRTFTNWFNDRLRGHLKVAKLQVKDLETDLKDGLLLIELMEKLAAPNKVGPYNHKPTIKAQFIENLSTVLRFITSQSIKLVNIGECALWMHVESTLRLMLDENSMQSC